jgi:hypothetical protein
MDMSEKAELARSLIIGLALGVSSFLLSNFLQASNYNFGFTEEFIKMSLHPFTTETALRYRILIPLIGYLTGLKGHYYFILSLIGVIVFLTVVNYWAYRFYNSRITAALITSLLVGLPTVLFTNVFYGWSDIYCYIFLMLALLSPRYSFIYIFLGILTHEFFLTYIPFIYLYHYRFNRDIFADRAGLMRQACGLFIVFASYGIIRFFIASSGGSAYTLDFYARIILEQGIFYKIERQPVLFGFLTAYEAALVLFILFLNFLVRNYKKHFLDSAMLISALLPALVLFISHDTTRVWSNTFIFILLFPAYLPATRNFLLLIIAVVNLLIPSFYLGGDWMAPLDRQAKLIYARIAAAGDFNNGRISFQELNDGRIVKAALSLIKKRQVADQN